MDKTQSKGSRISGPRCRYKMTFTNSSHWHCETLEHALDLLAMYKGSTCIDLNTGKSILLPMPNIIATKANSLKSGRWYSVKAISFLLDCITEGKNILWGLLILIPCEIKYNKR